MNKLKDGGTAFPMQDGQAIHAYAAAKLDAAPEGVDRDAFYNKARQEAVSGMSLRDYFAAKALQGYLASFDPHGEPVEYATKIAEDAYAMANAMLTARESDPGQVVPETNSSDSALLPEKNCEPTCAKADRVYEEEHHRENDSGPYTYKKCGFYMPF